MNVKQRALEALIASRSPIASLVDGIFAGMEPERAIDVCIGCLREALNRRFRDAVAERELVSYSLEDLHVEGDQIVGTVLIRPVPTEPINLTFTVSDRGIENISDRCSV